MKSKCSFILKSATALVLALLLLFGTVATSLAAVVEEPADTGAEADVAETGWTESQCYIHIQIGSGSWTDYYMSNGKIYFYVSADSTTCKFDFVAENTWYKRNSSDTIPDGSSSSTTYYAKTTGSDFSKSLNKGLYCVEYSTRYDNDATLAYKFYKVNYFKPGSTIYFNTKVGGTGNSRWDSDSAKISAWFFNGSGSSVWASGTACPDSNSHVYRITVPASSSGVFKSLLFARSSDAKSGTTFGSVWNQTVDLDATSMNQDGGAWYPNALNGTTSQNTLTSTTHTHTLNRYKYIRDNSSVATYTQSGAVTTTYPDCSSSTVDLTSSFTAPSGYTLDGWYTTNSSGTLSGPVNTPTAVTNNVSGTYYAAYTHNNVTLSFDSNGGNSVADQSVGYNAAPTDPGDPGGKTGYDFDEWVTTDGGNTAFNFSTQMTSDQTAFAKWTEHTYSITYKDGDDNSTIAGLTPTSRLYTDSVDSLPDASKEGKNFLGWWTEADGGSQVTSISANTASDTTLYAHWEDAGTCSLSADPEELEIAIGETSTTVTVSGNEFCTQSSYTFAIQSGSAYITLNNASGTTFTVTGKDDGNAVVRASCTDGTYVDISVTVTAPTVAFNATSKLDGNIGTTVTNRTATGSSIGGGATSTLTYSSSDTSVATVNSSTGAVTRVAPGTVTVTATYIVKVSGTEKARATASYQVGVNTPTITAPSYSTDSCNIGAASSSATSTTTNPSSVTGSWSKQYGIVSGGTGTGTINTSTGAVTGTTPGKVRVMAYLYYGETQVAESSTYTEVTVNAPTIAINNKTNLMIGESYTPTITLTNPNATNDDWTVVFTKSADNGATTFSDTTITGDTYNATGDTYRASYKYKGTEVAYCTFNVQTAQPSITFNETAQDLNIGSTLTTFTATGGNKGSGATGTISYGSSDSDVATVDGSGVVTGIAPGMATITATYTVKIGEVEKATVSKSYVVTVATPVISMADQTVVKGDEVIFSATCSNATGLTYTYAVSPAVTGVSIDAATGRVVVASTCAASSADIVVTARNSAGTVVNDIADPSSIATLNINNPSMTIANTSDSSTQYLTLGTDYVKTLTNNFGGTYTAVTVDDDIATASVSEGVLTVHPVAKGRTTVTVTVSKAGAGDAVGAAVPARFFKALELASTGANVTNELVGSGISVTQTFTVNVAEADSYNYFYFTNGVGWSDVDIYMWKNSDDSVKNAAWPGDSMVKIGKNEENKDVYAYRYNASAGYDRLIISNHSNNSQRVQIGDTSNLTLGTHNAAWCNTANTNNAADWYDCTIAIPQVVIDDASTPLGTNYTLTATNVTQNSVGKYKWSSATTSVATVTADTNTTPSTTVTPVDAGTSVVTVKAFAVAPTNWTLTYNDTTLPFLGTTDTATITVTADDRTVAYSAKASYDHSDYDSHDGEGGTITTSPNVTSGSTVAHGTTVTFTAVPSSGYKHVGWRVGTGSNEFTTSAKEITVRADTTVYALFDKYYTLTISESADHGDVSSAGCDVVWAVAPASFTVTPATGYMIDYANCTNLSTFYTVDESLTTGTVTFTGTTVAEDSKADTTVTIAYKKLSYTLSASARYTTDGTTYTDGNTGGSISYTTQAQYEYGDTITITATAASPTADINYYCEKIEYSTDGGSTWNLIATVPTAAAAVYTDGTMYNNSFTLNATGTSSYQFRASFKAYYFVTLYNSWMRESDSDPWEFVAAPPRTVNIISGGATVRTYTYKAGTVDQRGEDNEYYRSTPAGSEASEATHIVSATGNYYEGNKLLVYAGESVKLNYSNLASSDAIRGVFFFNDKRYTTELEPDNYYVGRSHAAQTGAFIPADSEYKYGHYATGDDDSDYDFLAGTTLYADSNYYDTSASPYSNILSEFSSYAAKDGVNQINHTVEWTPTKNAMNLDIELDSKRQLVINSDNWNGITVSGLNTEGYYYTNEQVGKVGETGTQLKVSLDNSDSTRHFSFTGTYTEKDKFDADVEGFTITAYTDGDVEVNPVTPENARTIAYYTISCASMPSKDVYINLGVNTQYEMKLSNAVLCDTIDNKKLLNQTDQKTYTVGATGESSATGHIGTITALVNYVPAAGETPADDDGDIAYENDSTYHWYYPTGGTVVEDNDYSHNNYLKRGGVNKAGSRINAGDTVTYTFTFNTDNANSANYSFLGWFAGDSSGYDPTKKLNGKETFTYTPTADTYVWAVGTRDLYIQGDFNVTNGEATKRSTAKDYGDLYLMSYDATYKNGAVKGRYYYTFDSVTKDSYYHYVFRDNNNKAANDNYTVWNDFSGAIGPNVADGTASDDGTRWGRNADGGEADDKNAGYFSWRTVDESAGYGCPVTVYFYPTAVNNADKLSVKAEYKWAMAYVSAGAGVFCTNFDAALGGAAATFNNPTVSVANKTVNDKDVVITDRGASYFGSASKYESIKECQVKEPNGKIVLTVDSDNDSQELQAVVCYNVDTKESWAVYDFTPVEGQSHKWTANVEIPQNSKIYVVPVYKFTSAYASDPDGDGDHSDALTTKTVYVRTEDINKNKWGGLVAMYSYGEGNTSSGEWPGQLMIPSNDGSSFYAPLTFKTGGLSGVTINNYAKIWGSTGANFLSTYVRQSVSSTAYSQHDGARAYQSYDYREPISIIENMTAGRYGSDDMTLTFALKPGNKNENTHGNGAYETVSADNWEYLTDRTGKNRVDLNGNIVSGTATYYVVCNYTEGYAGDSPSEVYAPSPSTNGRYSIDWTVYDSGGRKVAGGSNYMSASYTDLVGEDGKFMTYIADAVLAEGQPVDGKAVMIAYENPQISVSDDGAGQTLRETVRYSGQWYNEGVNTILNVNVDVGIFADDVFTPSGNSNPGYATGSVALVTGASAYTVEGKPELSENFDSAYPARVTLKHASDMKVKLSVSTTDNFKGWYYYNKDDGEYKFISDDQDITPSFNTDMTYYAFYSAQASYVVKYTDRFGNAKQFTAKGTDLSPTELASGSLLDASARDDEILRLLAKANGQISVFNKNYDIDLSTPDTPRVSYVLSYTATVTDATYDLTVWAYNGEGVLSKIGKIYGTFNTEIDLTDNALGGAGNSLVVNKPSGYPGYVFVGWKKCDPKTGAVTGEILSTHANFGYSLTEDLAIAPVFAAAKPAATDTWNASVDKNVITQELTGEESGTIYNDSIISFRYSDDTGKRYDITEEGKECGIVILAQTKDVTSGQSTAFARADAEAYFNALKGAGKTSARMNKSTYGESYAFYIPATSLSRLNRVDIYQHLDYAKFSGGNYKVMAYYKDSSGTYRFSSVVTDTYTPHSYSSITGIRTPAAE